MTKSNFFNADKDEDTTPLVLFCYRHEFLSFNKMITCLIKVDSSVEVICDFIHCLCKNCLYQGILSGSGGERSLILFEKLLDMNPAVTKCGDWPILHGAAHKLRGELGVAILSSILI